MPIFEASLLCVHPLCRRLPTNSKIVRVMVGAAAPENAHAAARAALTNRDKRRCRECQRPIDLDHMIVRETDGNGNATARVVAPWEKPRNNG